MKVLSILINILLLGLLAFAVMSALFSPMLFDAPGSEKNTTIWALFWIIAAFPLTILVAMIWSWRKFFQDEYQTAILVSLIPVIIHIGLIALVFWLIEKSA